ncbi:MAG: 8-oxo-dGTP diphosphatase [Thermoplasmata archaeon]|nr:8-oxo-dGTP diphosphatase [Thermoplasmata archaeon]
MIEAVIVHIIRDGKILLNYKKRGHGKGKWNGFGGKIEKGETPEECAYRETMEEGEVKLKSLHHMGKIEFYNVNGEDWLVHVFRGEIDGEPRESEESIPRWFSIGEIPYENMWEDDRYWLPLLLNHLRFHAKFYFSGERMKRFKIEAWKDSPPQ